MTAPRLATATLLALVALTCDITEVAEPSYNPNAEPELTSADLAQDFIDRLNSFGAIRIPRSLLGLRGTGGVSSAGRVSVAPGHILPSRAPQHRKMTCKW